MALSPALFSSRSEEWETPQGLFDQLHREFDFTLDVCATRANAKCTRFFDKQRDGLAQDWVRERVFMNPPYGRDIGRWMGKARREAQRGALVVCLVHARTDTRWWHENVEQVAQEVRFIRGRVRFLREGILGLPAPFPSAIVVYRPGPIAAVPKWIAAGSGSPTHACCYRSCPAQDETEYKPSR